MSVDPRTKHAHLELRLSSATKPLSTNERSHLRGRWKAIWPSVVVATSLLSCLIVPLLVQHLTGDSWYQMANVLNPARRLTTEIQLALALEASSTEEFLQTGRSSAAEDHQRARSWQRRAESQLVPLAKQLGPDVQLATVELLAQIGPAEALLDSLFARQVPHEDYWSRVDEQRRRLRAVAVTAGRIDEAIGAEADRIRAGIQSTEHRGRLIEVALVLVAILAGVIVARLVRIQRSLAVRLDRRERLQTAFGRAARELNAAATTRDVIRTLVNTALDATSAHGVIVEIARASAAQNAVDVAMRVGADALREERVDSAASITSALAGLRAPGSIVDVPTITDEIAPYLAGRCDSCSGLAAIVRANGDIRATLVLLRLRNPRRFGDDDIAYLRALADVASAALRRVGLLEALRQSEERFRQIAENIREFIWLSDPEFTKHFYVNSAYEDIWGRSTESLYQNPWSLLEGVHPDDRSRVTAALSGLTRGVYDIEFRVVRPNGEERWVWSRGFPVTNARGEIYRVAGITEDITERKRTAENRVRLVRGFTHDVKNPLGAADGFLALLEDGIMGELEPKQRDSIGRARQSIRRALDLIGNVLELARAEAGQIEIRKAPMNLAAVADDIVHEFRAQAHEKGLALDVAQLTSVPPIESDESRVRQVVANLVSNAVKYTPPKGRIEVAVCTRSNADTPGPGQWVAIEVADDGPGIPRDKQRTLFTEFTRFDPTAAEGAGIGLSISQRLASALGGTITVQSDEGAGSTFTLWLPLSTAQ